jgi:hypothetical protein
MADTQNISSKITHIQIRMYRMGTGDCFALKFFAGESLKLKMMIDCGVWRGEAEHLEKYVANLKEYFALEGEKGVDVLVVTHEHKDHVYVFEACKNLFMDDFPIKEVWMGWPEENSKKVAQWKKKYGEKKKALSKASKKLRMAVESEDYKKQLEKEFRGLDMVKTNQDFAATVQNFTELHISSDEKVYKGDLEGMRIVKEEIAKGNYRCFIPGEIIDNIEGVEGIKIYVLGPPQLYEEVKIEEGKNEGESYSHNKELAKSDAFAAAIESLNNPSADVLAFDESFCLDNDQDVLIKRYRSEENAWRKIDYNWLQGAGSLALRMNSITNNLSLALAVEFEESGKVILLPGDAEYGSWASWHNIKWTEKSRDPQNSFTKDLLSRTVFYKVAHHLSHHGTAKRKGLEMMTHKDLVAMATLDYEVISSTWTSTMPNSDLIKALLDQTKGRVMITNEKGLFYDPKKTVPLSPKIKEARKKMTIQEAGEFASNYIEDPLYYQFTVKA